MPSSLHAPARIAAALAAVALLSCGGGGGGGGGTYHIDLRYLTTLTAEQQAAFEAAAARIEQIVTSNPSSVSVTWSPSALAVCELTGSDVPPSESIGGLAIFASVTDIPEAGVIAMSGPCLIRGSSHLPLAAVLEFDSQYLLVLSDTDLRKTILHEMLHTLGFGTMWGAGTSSEFGWDKLSKEGVPGTSFTGTNALGAAKAENSAPSSWASVPVEDCVTYPGKSTGGQCGAGTQDAHWQWETFKNELMTGWIVPGADQPLSATTIASLQDIGYTVDMSKADAYAIPSTAAARALDAGAHGLWIGNDVRKAPPLEVPEF